MIKGWGEIHPPLKAGRPASHMVKKVICNSKNLVGIYLLLYLSWMVKETFQFFHKLSKLERLASMGLSTQNSNKNVCITCNELPVVLVQMCRCYFHFKAALPIFIHRTASI